MGGGAEGQRRPRTDVEGRAGYGDLGQPLLTPRRLGAELEEQLFAALVEARAERAGNVGHAVSTFQQWTKPPCGQNQWHQGAEKNIACSDHADQSHVSERGEEVG